MSGEKTSDIKAGCGTDSKIKITIPATKYTIDTALISSLGEMEILRRRKASFAISFDLRDTPKLDLCIYDMLMEYARERMMLGGRDRLLPEFLDTTSLKEPDAKQWVTDTDFSHTIASLSYLAEICKGERISPKDCKVVLSAMIVHDCAYPVTKSFDDFVNEENRKLHMQNAEQHFRTWSQKINAMCRKSFGGEFYSGNDIELICRIVRQHDNPGIGIDFDYAGIRNHKLLWAHREADRLWMVHRAGFALDLVRRLLEENPWYDPKRYMRDKVIARHVCESAIYAHDLDKCLPYSGQKTLYRTHTGMMIFEREVKARAQEYGFKI